MKPGRRIENIWLQRPALVMGVTAALCLAAFFEARKVRFDYNLLKLQSPNLPSVVFAQSCWIPRTNHCFTGRSWPIR